MSTRAMQPRRVLVVTDQSDTQIALRSAKVLADRWGATLEFFACVEPPHDLNVLARLAAREPTYLLDELRERIRHATLARLTEYLPDDQIALQVAVGKTFVEVVRHVITTECDFVVKLAEPLSGVHRLLFASTDQHLLRKCPCPVWLQTPDAPAVPKRVLAAVDVDEWDAAEPETLHLLNLRVLEAACTIAAPSDAQVTVLHAWDAIGEGLVWAFSSSKDARSSANRYVSEVLEVRHKAMSRLIDQSSRDTPDDDGVPLVPRLVRGAPERVLEEQSRELNADVVVMGTVARTGLSGIFIGNTAENIINSLACPVLAVKPDGFVSPLAER
ncbi:MAG: universal stress protein [Methyloceanibacter sp.]|nr:universal stress protein [Methyloceanibacter sp.]